MSEEVRIRAAEPADVALLFSWVMGLAEYEHAADRVSGSEAMLETALFGDRACAEAAIAEIGVTPAGFALCFATFSTWLCRPGLWIEDLYVSPAHRRRGVGRALLSHLARLALDRGCGRLEWAALNWNTPALAFYEVLGAERLGEWQTLRLEGAALARVADGPDQPG